MKHFFLFEYLYRFLYKEYITASTLRKLPRAENPEQNFIFSLFDYKNIYVKKMIRHIKKKSDPLLHKNIATLIHEELLETISEQQSFGYFKEMLIIPVPISRTRKRERGFNQTHYLAKYLAQYFSGKALLNTVQKKKTTRKQALIKKKRDRFSNIKNAFNIRQSHISLIHNKDIMLIDDLVTTGATLLEIKKLLEQSGARKVIAVTIAH